MAPDDYQLTLSDYLGILRRRGTLIANTISVANANSAHDAWSERNPSGRIAGRLQGAIMTLPLFMALSSLMMFSFGMMVANFTALAMEPQGHIAGTASSLYGSITTLIGIVVGMAIGQSFDGTLLPFSVGFFVSSLAALAIVLVVERGRLFKPHQRAIG